MPEPIEPRRFYDHDAIRLEAFVTNVKDPELYDETVQALWLEMKGAGSEPLTVVLNEHEAMALADLIAGEFRRFGTYTELNDAFTDVDNKLIEANRRAGEVRLLCKNSWTCRESDPECKVIAKADVLRILDSTPGETKGAQ